MFEMYVSAVTGEKIEEETGEEGEEMELLNGNAVVDEVWDEQLTHNKQLDAEYREISQHSKHGSEEPAEVVGQLTPWAGLEHFYHTGGIKKVIQGFRYGMKYSNGFQKVGMSVYITAIFIVGETAGGGLVALPSAMSKVGQCQASVIPVNERKNSGSGTTTGFAMLVLLGLLCLSTAHMLADAFTILQLR